MAIDPRPGEPEAPPNKPRKKRRALRIAGTILGVPLLLAGLGVGYLHTGAGKARIKHLLEERLHERVNGTIELGVVDYALFGDVKLGDVHVKDEAGVEAASLTSLTVTPSWGDLVRGNLVIDRVALSGLSVHVIKDADGGSNLKRLIKPIPEDPNKKPLDKRIVVKALSIGSVGVDILQPDGTKVVVSDAGIEGNLTIHPARKDVEVEIGRIGLTIAIDKGEGKLKVGVQNLETGVTVSLLGGFGKATLHPLKGHVALTLPENRGDRGFDIGLEGFSADIGANGLGVSLSQLLAGAVALASVEVKGRLTDGSMDGRQQADVLGLKVSGARINELLGKNVLLGDVDVETHVDGPPDKIELRTKITSGGASVAIDGSVGIADPANPTYDMGLTVTDVDTEKLLSPDMGVSPVTMDKLEVSLKGKGPKVETAGALAKLKITGITAKGVKIDGLELLGELEKGILKVKSVDAKAIGQRLTASGEVELATKRIDLTVGIHGDVGEALGKLKAAGLPIKSNLPTGAIRFPDGDLKVHAKGLLGGIIDVDVGAKRVSVLGGTVAIDAHAALIRHDPPLPDGKKVSVTAMDADIHLAGIKLSSILAMRGKKLQGMDGTLGGDIHVEGTPQSPKAKILLGLNTSRQDGGKTARLTVTGDVNPTAADLRVSLLPSAGGDEIFGLRAKLPLSLGGQKKGIDPYRSLDVHAELPKKTLADLWQYVPKDAVPGIQTLPPGDVALSLDVKGTAAKPDGKLHLSLLAAAIPGQTFSQKVELDATLKPTGEGTALAAHTDVDVWFDSAKAKVAHVAADVDVSRSPVLGKPEIAYRAGITAGPIGPADLPMLDAKTQAIGGNVTAKIDVQGNREDATAKVTVTADGLRPTQLGQVGAVLTASLNDADTDLDLKVKVADSETSKATSDLLALSGKIGLAGKKLFATLKDKEHLDPSLGLALAIPKRALASLAVLRPNLAKAPGNVSGSIAVNGTAKVPLAKGTLAVTDVKRMDGKDGGAGVSLDLGADQISALLGVGVADPTAAPLQIAIHAPREPAFKLSKGASLPLTVAIRGKAIDLRQIVPAVLLEDTLVGVKGTLDWNMDVQATLAKKDDKVAPIEGSVTGQLDLHDADVAIPGTKRSYHDIGLLLKADDTGLHLDALRAKESDLDEKERSITVKADIGLAKLRPTKVALTLATQKWLVFGPRQLGFADAPRGTLTLSAEAKADLTTPVKTAKIDVKSLELLMPERFERAHQPEDVQAGDIVFLDAEKRKGKLPVPAAPEKKPDTVAAKTAGSPEGDKPKEEEEGFDIGIHIADNTRLLQAPIELAPHGDIQIKIRPEGREITGKLTVEKGKLQLGGQYHPVVTGSLTFDKQNPKGYLDLYFERPMKPSALRDISEASAGNTIKVHMYGSIADRKTVLSGAGSPGALWDILSMHNVGRERHVSGPDLPGSMAIDFPQHDSLLVLSFLSVNLPHLLFLDRFGAWADPYDDSRAYGRLTHFEAERYVASDTVRVKASTRPPSAGESEAELEIDYLFVNVPRMLFGVGLTGGTRGGGGPGVVWEWSSKD